MNPQEQKAPEEQWQQPAVSPNSAPYQAVPDTETQTDPYQVVVNPVVEPEDQAPINNENTVVSESSTDDTALLQWQATEYIHQDRTVLWYVMLAIVTAVLMIVAFVVIKSLTFTILLPVMAVTLVMYVRRPPVPNSYFVSRKGVHVNDKLYTYDQFSSFGVITHQGHHSVVLVPRKRFQLGQTLYFPEEIGEKLVDMFAARLPMKEVQPDLIDRLLARLHL